MRRPLSFRTFVVIPSLLLGLGSTSACYDTGDGTAPPLDSFYFPVGLQVSHGGSVLYAVNSDFDLQFNGGTVQSYDLRLIRSHVLDIIADPRNVKGDIRLVRRGTGDDNPCLGDPPVQKEGGQTGRQPLGETCAPPVDSRAYFRDSAVIGAFATELLLSPPPDRLVPQSPKATASEPLVPAGARGTDRLFMPVRGNATLTWITVVRDTPDAVPPNDTTAVEAYAPWRLSCGQDGDRRCDAAHQVGEDPNEVDNTSGITMPGEPFGMAMSEDGRAIVITHQNQTQTSLYSTGLAREDNDGQERNPSIQFVLEEVPFGGVGITPIPHDRDAFVGAPELPRAAFLESSRVVPELSLIRQYPDEFGGLGSARKRPFLDLERSFPVIAAAGGNDSRGVVIDPTPRLACKAKVKPVDGTRSQADVDRDIVACARKPARAFIANRSPAALLVGDIGVTEGTDGAYDPDKLLIHTSIPLAAGPSKVYLAPIVDKDGRFALRAFVVCFDAAMLFVIDPDTGVLENVIRTAPGPFALAFDPFTLEGVARNDEVPIEKLREPEARGLRKYRFAYLASFTQSFVQIIDLDDAQPNRATFEKIVFTLGNPTNPKGS
jgi:hypothetical protein